MADTKNGMELQTFIAQTLLAIVNGVHEAQTAISGSSRRGYIVPIRSHNSHAKEQDVEFDVAVTVAAGSGLDGKSGFQLKVPVIQIGAGIEGKSSESESKTSRVRFTVPVAMPGMQLPEEPDVQREHRDIA